MTILNKKAFALVALLMTSVCVQAMPAADGAAEPLQGGNRKKRIGVPVNVQAFINQFRTKKAAIALVGCAAGVAVVVATVSYYKAQQAAKLAAEQPVAEVVAIEVA